ncbi:ABC transporter ATP-binding protein [Acetobacterium sp.]|jgi:ABC-2 type transport system ATP-binding protein|uniref:ABC transporter ATP-binding protein n=1 Tax=Acetobacterium sp. TaxID=1872094 RepID=UPI000CB8C295|nr:ABC transporter ATP-binding protein [Acetobacterium sp.]MDO9491553.1 ABC transporter ATP-binding protein [Acetobacterium sp.]PKM74676.1 MAG: multidrug ABC transporter ATP-binding protein [Firmicutes bacterium HGW-Firmicutes-17]
MLEIIAIEKKFDNKKVLDNINFIVNKGEFFGLLGSNGAGKTTMIKLISTLLLPSDGKILLDGKEITRNNVQIKKKITTVTQEYTLRGDMDVDEIMEYQGRLYQLPREQRKKDSKNLLEFCGLMEHRKKRVRELSGGMKRKLMLCRALLPKPELVLLDEPTVGLDPFSRRQIWDLISGLNQQGMTFILTTHYMEEAQMLCQRIALIDQGQLLEIAPPQELINQLGNIAINVVTPVGIQQKYFKNRERALDYAKNLSDPFTLRETNLEDVFIKRLGRGID